MDDKRNVIDYYKYWKTDAIKADLDTKRHNFSVLISNVFHDFNIGTIIRNNNAFMGAAVYVYGRKKFDRRGAVGTYFYENMQHVKHVEELPFNDSHYLVGVDNIPEASAIEDYVYPKDKHVVFVLGQEDVGIPDELKAICKEFIYIRQYGSVRSMNVGVASGLVMHDWCRKSL